MAYAVISLHQAKPATSDTFRFIIIMHTHVSLSTEKAETKAREADAKAAFLATRVSLLCFIISVYYMLAPAENTAVITALSIFGGALTRKVC